MKKDSKGVILTQKFIDNNKTLEIEPIDKCIQTVNYFKGNDSSKWKTKVPTFRKIIYRQICEGVDIVYYGQNGNLKYDFIVQPGAAVEDIKFTYSESFDKYIDKEGNLIIKTDLISKY